MTKEELEKEAEEYASEEDICVCGDEYWSHNDIKQAYLASAEPREKRIQALGERCLQLQKDKGNLIDRVKELEAQIEKMKCCGNCSHFKLDNSGLYPIHVCELTLPNRCRNHDKWELEEKCF